MTHWLTGMSNAAKFASSELRYVLHAFAVYCKGLLTAYYWNPKIIELIFYFRSNIDNSLIVKWVRVPRNRRSWHSLIQDHSMMIISIEYCRPHNLLVFINPVGGKGKATQIYTKKVAPIFVVLSYLHELPPPPSSCHLIQITLYLILMKLRWDWCLLLGFMNFYHHFVRAEYSLLFNLI